MPVMPSFVSGLAVVARLAAYSIMHITRRSSGGRGEYEISEDLGPITPRDLDGRAITLVLGEGWEFPTGTILKEQGGKRRLRLANHGIQLHRQVAAALMMPGPVRTRDAFGDGLPVLREGAYAIESIELAGIQLIGVDEARLTIGEVLVENGNHHAEPIGYDSRLDTIPYIWESVSALPPELAQLVALHRSLVTTGGPVTDEAESVVAELQRVLTANADDYGTIIRLGSEDVVNDLQLLLRRRPPRPTVHVEDVAPLELEIRKRVVKEWKRWSNARGPESRRFKEAVRAAYDSTCIFCGLRLPKSSLVSSPGVDAAHILPWAEYDLDHISNGVCCCKLHHWAFDEGLLILRWDDAETQYVVEVPADIAEQLHAVIPTFDIGEFERLSGPVPDARLPARAQDRPRPECLRLLNDGL